MIVDLTQAQLDETVDALEAAQRLSEQLDHKEEMIAALREEGRMCVCVCVCVLHELFVDSCVNQ